MKKKIFCITAGIISSLAFSLTAFAGTWQQTGAGWTYLKDNNQYATNELVADNNQLYYLGADGVMKTGFVPINGVYYYFAPAGNMQTGWVFDNNAWYYMQTDAAHFGQMAVNVNQNVNGKNYYFGADGKMVHDTTIGQVTYGADGAAVTYGQNTNTGSSKPVVTNLMINGAAVAGGQDLDLSELSKYGINLGNMDVGGNLTQATQSVSSFDHDTGVTEIYNLVNQERAKRGLNKLVLSESLNEIADQRAEEIVNDYSHNGLHAYAGDIRDIFGQVKISENIDGNFSASGAMNAWMNSSGHRANILNPNFSNIGIGAYKTGSMIYFVQLFVD